MVTKKRSTRRTSSETKITVAGRKVSSSSLKPLSEFQETHVEGLLEKVDFSYALSFGYTLKDVEHAKRSPKHAAMVYTTIQGLKSGLHKKIVMAGGDVEVTKNSHMTGWCIHFPGSAAESITDRQLFTMMLLEMNDTGYSVE
jgi:hypothetical protein